MSASIFFSLAFAHFLAVISPGPDFFYVVKTSLQKRLSYALIASFAIGFGVFLHSMFSVYAFRILYQIIPNLYVFIGSLGGMYLLYLGISGLRNNEIEELANSTQRKEEENLFKVEESICMASSYEELANGADAILILTEWVEFKKIRY